MSEVWQAVPCDIWKGRTDRDGYGMVTRRGKERRYHQITWEAAYGPVPEGLEIDHLCGVRNCGEVRHLEAVTHLENVRRGNTPGVRFDRDGVCFRGHVLAEVGIYMPARGHRECLGCRKVRQMPEWKTATKHERAALFASAGGGGTTEGGGDE